MSKAILVLGDMPTNCDDCWVSRQTCDGSYCGNPPSWGLRLPDDCDKRRPSWCPLKELPKHNNPVTADVAKELRKANFNVDYHHGYTVGWNACLDEFLGGDTDE